MKKKIIVVVIVLGILVSAISCYAQVVLHRYTEIATGDEMGVCYSGKDGSPAISNPDWNVEIIDESQKDFYIDEQGKQIKARKKARKDAIKAKRKDIKNKLKALGLNQSEVDILVGESD